MTTRSGPRPPNLRAAAAARGGDDDARRRDAAPRGPRAGRDHAGRRRADHPHAPVRSRSARRRAARSRRAAGAVSRAAVRRSSRARTSARRVRETYIRGGGAARRRRPADQNECGAHTRAVLPPLEAHAPHVGEEDNSRTLAPPPPQDNETRERATRAASERARRACVRTRHRVLADLTQREEREVEPRVGRDPRAPRAERAADRALDAERVARPRGRQQHLKLGRE